MTGVVQYLAVVVLFVCTMLLLLGVMELIAWFVRPSRADALRERWVEALFNGGSLWKP